VNLLRNEKVLVDGRVMVVTEANRDGLETKVAEHGWDGETPGMAVPTSKVVPLEQMLPGEAFEFIDSLPARQLIEALHFMAQRAPQVFLEYGRAYGAERLPVRLRPVVKSGGELAAFEDVDGGGRRG
jgi:hypothetical protein